MKCLVTGGAGFIGSNLTHALVEAGHEVRVLDNFSTGHRENLEDLKTRIEILEEDLRDGHAVMRACEGMEVVFHQGAMPSVPRSIEDPLTSFQVNSGGTLNVMLGAKMAGVRRVVYAASSSAYGDALELPKHEAMLPDPKSPYAADKVHGEHLCRVFTSSFDLECVALRYFNVFGPRQRPDSAYAAVIPRFIQALLDGEAPRIHGDGLQSRDFTYIDNVIDANLKAAAAPGAAGGVFNVGFGQRVTLLELLEILQEIIGGAVEPVHEPPRVGDVKHSLADVSRAREILGYEPAVSLAEGLRRTVAWFRERRAEV